MKSMPQAQPARSAPHKLPDPSLAVLARSNHDMRSPLSVILGVLELLDDTADLSAGEQRYLQLGRDAAGDLVELADALRLYTAISRGSLTVDCAPGEFFDSARETLTAALRKRDITLHADPPATPVMADCDSGYLNLALSALGRHLASNLTEAPAADTALHLSVATDERWVRLEIAPPGRPVDDRAEALQAEPGTAEIALTNAVWLVELMGGRVYFDPAAPGLLIELAAAPA